MLGMATPATPVVWLCVLGESPMLAMLLYVRQGSVRDFLCRCPGVLTRDAASDLVPRLELLCGVGLEVGAARKLLISDGSLLIGDLEPTLQLRLHFLTSDCGLSPDQALHALRSCPEMMSFTLANLGRKWRFLKERMAGGKEQVLEYPQFLTKNLLLQIGPRFSYATERLGLHLSRCSSTSNSPDADGTNALRGARCATVNSMFTIVNVINRFEVHFAERDEGGFGVIGGRTSRWTDSWALLCSFP
ncbi:hypothetical protein Vafri_6726 [Volvox africanus]|uniref:Uncharacterized protein n=1 Tax=Volvox africanus TaxID=51714 RepID=A0A8J4AYY9_9CHLO|nr:hypothetical protein Vafri_6726 [Volvox africanus]